MKMVVEKLRENGGIGDGKSMRFEEKVLTG